MINLRGKDTNMTEIDLEDFLEEIKFQMTEYEELDEKIILDWELRTRRWVKDHNDKKRRIVKLKRETLIKVEDEDITYTIAERFYRAYSTGKLEEYWAKFSLL